jgi:hypothetical protein
MDYYEELGLKRTATVQEIRQAYKVLARLVHPDVQANEPVRGMAERQMKRLNEILATLTNEQARREYDAGLGNAVVLSGGGSDPGAARGMEWRLTEAQLVAMPEWVRSLAENWFWIALGVVVVGVGIWYAAQVGPGDGAAGRVVQDKAQMVGARPANHREVKPADLKTARGNRGPKGRPAAAVKRPAQAGSKESPAASPSVVAAPPEAPTEAPAASVQAVTSAPESGALTASAPARERIETAASTPAVAVKPHESLFAGNWLYLPDPSDKIAPGVYPATYAELLLGEDRGGRLRGRYRAEYRVVDQPVSPEVTFEMEGDAPEGVSAHFRWTSADGAKGDADLALAGPNVLKMTWWTTAFGRHTILASGTSRLIRQAAP